MTTCDEMLTIDALEDEGEFETILPDYEEEVIEYRLRAMSDAISKETLAGFSKKASSASVKSLGFELVIEKRNDDAPEFGIERIAAWMSRVADWYSCAVTYVEREDGTSYYRAIVCFKAKTALGDVQAVFPMAKVATRLDYKKCFYNTIFGLSGHDMPIESERVVMRKVIGEIACSIESKRQTAGGAI